MSVCLRYSLSDRRQFEERVAGVKSCDRLLCKSSLILAMADVFTRVTEQE